MDWPSAFYWRELIALYPDARVILTWRTPESWWTSFENTILKVLNNSEDRESLGHLLVAEGAFGGRPDDREHAILIYERHVDEVIATVPEDRLLVHRIGDGWEPLCRHLGVDAPEDDYPRLNAAGGFFDKAGGGSASER